MPELGEVAHAASILRRALLGQVIKHVDCAADEIVLVKPLDPPVMSAALTGKRVTSVGRQGKYFWFACEPKIVVLLHFGMTGWVHVRNSKTHFLMMESASDKVRKEHVAKQREQLKAQAKVDDSPAPESELWPPKFTKFSLTTDNGTELAFTDPRRLARVRLYTDSTPDMLQSQEPLSKLGPDYSQTPLSESEVVAILQSRKTPIKSLLMNQALFSGIGNWMADEILFQARIHPALSASALSDRQAALIYKQLIEVCRISVETEANVGAFPSTWLMAHRWGKRKKNEVQRTSEGHELAYISIGGRTSCYAPALQKLEPTLQAEGALGGAGASGDTLIKTEDTGLEVKSDTRTNPRPKKIKIEEAGSVSKKARSDRVTRARTRTATS